MLVRSVEHLYFSCYLLHYEGITPNTELSVVLEYCLKRSKTGLTHK